ncbi:hypothetical protein DAPPUDRAFT_265287 [Daphnia pulex]|uniref:Chromo domain-containing protein n=1 Tax=Daphnia pulex TaxID=6669 RepID=E9HT70_DAPPU|nr:hypothetical protein DAPPUDRAFT_265287 [Daphnia pulex]|eukprot:EFX65065.1 hypothetical protein DAPPUDRAFT_265287 [Daphnia pulex]
MMLIAKLSRKYKNKTMYLIKWKDYSDAEKTWKPYSHLHENYCDAIKKFRERNVGVKKRLSQLNHKWQPSQMKKRIQQAQLNS